MRRWVLVFLLWGAWTTSASADVVRRVYMSYGYPNEERFRQDVTRFTEKFFSIEPFKSRRAEFQVLGVWTTVDLRCQRSTSMTRLIACSSSAVRQVLTAQGIKADWTTVLVYTTKYGGSGSTDLAVSYSGGILDSTAPKVDVHESGHAYGNLLDEYNLYNTNGSVQDRVFKNCYLGAQPPAAEWPYVATTEYRRGCKYPNWWQPAPCSVMENLSCWSFNEPSIRLLNTEIDASVVSN